MTHLSQYSTNPTMLLLQGTCPTCQTQSLDAASRCTLCEYDGFPLMQQHHLYARMGYALHPSGLYVPEL